MRSKRETKCSRFNCEDSKHFSLEERRDVLLLEQGKRSVCRSCGDSSEDSGNIDLTNQEGLRDNSINAEPKLCVSDEDVFI